jgi:hypothetical protein
MADEIEDENPEEPASDRCKDTLFVTDEEMIRRLGVPRKAARAAITMLDRDPAKGFPQKQALWGKRRYWPAVRDWFDRQYIPSMRSRLR